MLTRNTKLLVGAAIVYPLVWGVLLAASVLFAFSTGALQGGIPPAYLAIMFAGHALAVIVGLGSWVWSLMHAARSTALTTQQRTLWIVLLAVFSTLAAVPYFIKHVWPER